MVTVNETKKQILAKKARFCKSEFSKIRGLMFTKRIKKALIFVFRKESLQHIHMFFVWYPIDVLWLDKNKKIVQLKENLKPFRIILAKRPAKYIIELGDGTIRKTKTELDDIISF
jgi:uncharacterized membrane protein (UPF0127 family)